MLKKEILEKIELKYGQKIRYPKDCEILAGDISLKTGNTISSSTVKRLFGFIKTESKPNQYTLDTIALYLGFPGWDELNQTELLPEFNQDAGNAGEDLIDNRSKTKKIILLSLAVIFAVISLIKILNTPMPDDSGIPSQEEIVFTNLPDLPEARNGGRALMYQNDIYYVSGSDAAFMRNNTWKFDSKSNQWKVLSPLPVEKAATGCAIVNDNIYCFGGWLGNNIGMTASVEMYNIISNEWKTLPDTPHPFTSAHAVSKGKYIYMLAGTIGETTTYFYRFDTEKEIYDSLPCYPESRMDVCMILYKNRIFAIAGNSFRKGEYNWHNEVDEYDIEKNKWTKRSPLPMKLTSAGSVLIGDDIHITGGITKYGHNNEGILKKYFIYDIRKDEWHEAPSLPFKICNHQAVYYNGKMVLIGGTSEFPNPLRRVVSIPVNAL